MPPLPQWVGELRSLEDLTGWPEDDPLSREPRERHDERVGALGSKCSAALP